jgi:hypothetical protein
MSLYDENAEVLRELENRGSDLGSPRMIDFSHVFQDEAAAQAFAAAVTQAGFGVAVEAVERDDHPWDVTVSKVMAPTCENITQAEDRLDVLAQSHGGHSDGWGFFDP